jgi:hypothetical protein
MSERTYYIQIRSFAEGDRWRTVAAVPVPSMARRVALMLERLPDPGGPIKPSHRQVRFISPKQVKGIAGVSGVAQAEHDLAHGWNDNTVPIIQKTGEPIRAFTWGRVKNEVAGAIEWVDQAQRNGVCFSLRSIHPETHMALQSYAERLGLTINDIILQLLEGRKVDDYAVQARNTGQPVFHDMAAR